MKELPCPLNTLAFKQPWALVLEDSKTSLTAIECEYAVCAIKMLLEDRLNPLKKLEKTLGIENPSPDIEEFSLRSCGDNIWIAMLQWPTSLASVLLVHALMRLRLPCLANSKQLNLSKREAASKVSKQQFFRVLPWLMSPTWPLEKIRHIYKTLRSSGFSGTKLLYFGGDERKNSSIIFLTQPQTSIISQREAESIIEIIQQKVRRFMRVQGKHILQNKKKDMLLEELREAAFSPASKQVAKIFLKFPPQPQPVSSAFSPVFFPSEAALVAFNSSGSQGDPKAIVHSLAGIRRSSKTSNKFFKLGGKSRTYLCLPLWHASGFGLWMRSLYAGARLYVAGSGSFKADKTLLHLKEKGITHASLVPAQLLDLVALPAGLKKLQQLKTLKALLLGGSSISSSLWKLRKKLPVYPVYGMTESFGHIAVARPEERQGWYLPLEKDMLRIEKQEVSIHKKIVAIAIATIGMKTTDMDAGCLSAAVATSKDEKLRQPRRILEQERERGFLPLPFNEAGFFRTGDLGTLKKGLLHIKGRADTLIISGGENMYAEEIENALNEIVFIKASCVVPTPDARFGQRPCALLLLQHARSMQGALKPKSKNLREPYAKNRRGLKRLIELELSKSLEKFKIPQRFFLVEQRQQTKFFSDLNKPLRRNISKEITRCLEQGTALFSRIS